MGTQSERLPFTPDRLDDFDASSVDIVIGEDVTDTLVLGQEVTIEDDGANTVIAPLREDDDAGTETGRKER